MDVSTRQGQQQSSSPPLPQVEIVNYVSSGNLGMRFVSLKEELGILLSLFTL